MQLIPAKVLGRRLVRRPAEKSREVPHGPNVVPLGVLAEPARRHVVDHALPQGADGLVGHRETSCLAWGCEPHPETGPSPRVVFQFSPSSSRDRGPIPCERFSPLAHSRPSSERICTVGTGRFRSSGCRSSRAPNISLILRGVRIGLKGHFVAEFGNLSGEENPFHPTGSAEGRCATQDEVRR